MGVSGYAWSTIIGIKSDPEMLAAIVIFLGIGEVAVLVLGFMIGVVLLTIAAYC